MTVFSEEAQARAVRYYLSNSESPACPCCGEELLMSLDYSHNSQPCVRGSCPGCGGGFSWIQPVPRPGWKKLHMAYFAERVRAGKDLRCPFDDCRITYAVYEEGIHEFRCPFCSRYGRTDWKTEADPSALTSDENESIVFLTV